MAYKILSLDGGGAWALIQARVLEDLYDDKQGHEILKDFDVAIANSGGSLILAALCCNLRPSEIASLFEEEEIRKTIFAKLKFYEYNLLSLIKSIWKKSPVGAKYSAKSKKKGLYEVMGKYNTSYGEPIIKTPLRLLPGIIGKESLQLLIVGFDYFRERASFFRSNANSLTDRFNKKFYDITLGDAIHASTNAPINFFQEYAEVEMSNRLLLDPGPYPEKKRNWYWDGAVAGFNNPVLAGVVEAITNEPTRDLNEFKVLSIGTGYKSKAVIVDHKYSSNPMLKARHRLNRNKPFVISDNSTRFTLEVGKMAESILSDPPDSASFIASSILNRRLDNSNCFVRINPCITPVLNKTTNEFEIPAAYKDQPEKFREILALEMDAVDDKDIKLVQEIIRKFLREQSIPNQYIRGENGPDQVLGFGTYAEAKGRWQGV